MTIGSVALGGGGASSADEAAVVAQGLEKAFGETTALQGLDLVVPRGSLLGVLGPNGAGKTTAVRILTTLLIPDAGSATVDGIDVIAQPGRVRARIGLTGQYAAVEERLTGRENLELVCRYFHMSRRDTKARSVELLERFALTDAGDRVVKGYSGGMRRRLDIAMSLVARPSVLFLDEPTTGLDPRSRLAMWDLISELRAEGTTTLLTTQYLEEADRLADSITVIDRGRVIEEGTADQLKDRLGGNRVAVTIRHADNLGRARAAIAGLCTGEITDDGHRHLEASIATRPGIVPEAIRLLDDAGVDVLDVEVHRPTLDDVFLTLTGHSADDLAPDESGGEQP
jgi:ABC-2 type transport system ATP-binding protein